MFEVWQLTVGTSCRRSPPNGQFVLNRAKRTNATIIAAVGSTLFVSGNCRYLCLVVEPIGARDRFDLPIMLLPVWATC